MVQHIEREDAYDPRRTLAEQRQYGHFVSPMCKTLCVRSPVRWTPGFHASTARPSFGGLYLVHLRWVDLSENLRRLATTRRLDWGQSTGGEHQRAPISSVLGSFQNFAGWPIKRDDDLLFEHERARLLDGLSIKGDFYLLPQDVRPNNALVLPSWMTAGVA